MRRIHTTCPLCGAEIDLEREPSAGTCICTTCFGEFAVGGQANIILECPSCAMEMSVQEVLMDEAIDCPHCAHEFVPRQVHSVARIG